MEIFLIRHTRVGVEAGICYGRTDVPLADSFDEDCDEVRRKLPDLSAAAIYCSPATRCQRLAERLRGPRDVTTDPRLLELNFGEWEMRRWDEIGIGTLNAWTEDVVTVRCPGGESFLDQYHRAVAFWQDLTRRGDAQSVVITHGGVIRALLAHFLDLPLDKSLRVNIDFGGITNVLLRQTIPIMAYINR